MPTQNHTYHLTAPAAPLAALYSLPPKPYTLKNFTFSAKERDSETGLSYFGSRYYSSDLSIWLSVDPQAAKYPGLSPFTYCANNPVKLVDPNGEEVVDGSGNKCYDANKGWLDNAPEDTKRIGEAMMKTKTGQEQFNKLVNSETKIEMNISSENRNSNDDCTMGQCITQQSDITKDNSGTYHISKAKIIIYEGSIKSYLDGSGSVNSNNIMINLGYGDSEQFTQSLLSGVSVDDYLGAVAGHESEHLTSQQNIHLWQTNKKNEAEVIPNRIKTKILLESNFK